MVVIDSLFDNKRYRKIMRHFKGLKARLLEFHIQRHLLIKINISKYRTIRYTKCLKTEKK